jgi:hypothetical protein
MYCSCLKPLLEDKLFSLEILHGAVSFLVFCLSVHHRSTGHRPSNPPPEPGSPNVTLAHWHAGLGPHVGVKSRDMSPPSPRAHCALLHLSFLLLQTAKYYLPPWHGSFAPLLSHCRYRSHQTVDHISLFLAKRSSSVTVNSFLSGLSRSGQHRCEREPPSHRPRQPSAWSSVISRLPSSGSSDSWTGGGARWVTRWVMTHSEIIENRNHLFNTVAWLISSTLVAHPEIVV